MFEISELLEALMMMAFGFAWPASILKSLRSRTARGKSLNFLVIVLIGYVCGIAAKVAAGHVNYVLVFYLINFFLISVDLLLFFRNRRLDQLNPLEAVR